MKPNPNQPIRWRFFGGRIRLNPTEYHVPWQAWPKEAGGAPLQAAVTEESTGTGGFVYTTRNFRFLSDVNLGKLLMTDLARVFELTYDLHTTSPFGILATPENKRFEARLFSTRDDYRKAGGPDILKQGGLAMLLAGESPAEVGRRIESALIKDLEMNLKFVENPKSNVLFQGFKH